MPAFLIKAVSHYFDSIALLTNCRQSFPVVDAAGEGLSGASEVQAGLVDCLNRQGHLISDSNKAVCTELEASNSRLHC